MHRLRASIVAVLGTAGLYACAAPAAAPSSSAADSSPAHPRLLFPSPPLPHVYGLRTPRGIDECIESFPRERGYGLGSDWGDVNLAHRCNCDPTKLLSRRAVRCIAGNYGLERRDVDTSLVFRPEVLAWRWTALEHDPCGRWAHTQTLTLDALSGEITGRTSSTTEINSVGVCEELVSLGRAPLSVALEAPRHLTGCLRHYRWSSRRQRLLPQRDCEVDPGAEPIRRLDSALCGELPEHREYYRVTPEAALCSVRVQLGRRGGCFVGRVQFEEERHGWQVQTVRLEGLGHWSSKVYLVDARTGALRVTGPPPDSFQQDESLPPMEAAGDLVKACKGQY